MHKSSVKTLIKIQYSNITNYSLPLQTRNSKHICNSHLLFQTDAHTRTSILTFLAIMAQNETNTNTVNNNGTQRAPFEMPTARSRNHFLQQNSVGRRLVAGSEQYVTPPARVSVFCLIFY